MAVIAQVGVFIRQQKYVLLGSGRALRTSIMLSWAGLFRGDFFFFFKILFLKRVEGRESERNINV